MDESARGGQGVLIVDLHGLSLKTQKREEIFPLGGVAGLLQAVWVIRW